METFIYPNHSHAKPLRAFEFLQQKTRIHILECYLPALQETKATIFCHPNNITNVFKTGPANEPEIFWVTGHYGSTGFDPVRLD